MKEKIKSWIIGIVIVIVLIIPIVVNYVKTRNIETISFSEYNQETTSQNFSLIYVGDLSKDKFSSKESDLLELRSKYDTSIKALNKEDISDEAWATIEKLNPEIKNDAYIFIEEGKIVYAASDLTKDRIDTLINKYYNDIIPEDEIAYKTFKTYKEFMKIVDSKTVSMIVFGRNSCSWCNKFKPVYNDAAAKYKIDIYYLDSDNFNSSEYSKIINSGITIPAKCTDTNTATPLSSGFGTPLTLFTKNGKSIDCISGYTNAEGLDNNLKTVGLIK